MISLFHADNKPQILRLIILKTVYLQKTVIPMYIHEHCLDYRKSMRNFRIPQVFTLIPDFAVFCVPGETKNPDFAWKSGFYCLLLFFEVVPPGIEPGTQGFSVLCSTN